MTNTHKKKMEFSKNLSVVVIVYYFIVVTAAVLMWMFTGRVMPSEILISGVVVPAMTAFGYLLKSGWENYGRNSSCNYNPNYGQQSYYPQSYSNTMYSGTMYGQSNRYNTPYQYNQPARY